MSEEACGVAAPSLTTELSQLAEQGLLLNHIGIKWERTPGGSAWDFRPVRPFVYLVRLVRETDLGKPHCLLCGEGESVEAALAAAQASPTAPAQPSVLDLDLSDLEIDL